MNITGHNLISSATAPSGSGALLPLPLRNLLLSLTLRRLLLP